jgi:hypothetical protein
VQPPSTTLQRALPSMRAISLPHIPVALVLTALAPFAIYLVLGAVIAFEHHAVPGDAWSRVGNAYYVLFSRDPHLAAMGFVWTPLPSFLVLPLLPFQVFFPGLVREGYAAVVVSAAAMAVAVWQLHGFLVDLRVRRSLRIVLTAVFALHPMIVLYGANGMSEALFVASLVITVRFVARWMHEPTTSSLVAAAMGLAVAYLTRYEAVIAAGAAGGVVAAVSYLRTRGAAQERRLTAAADLLVLLVPVGAAFLSWALASWIITGEPFPIFTSIYGNSAYVERAASDNAAATGQGTAAAVAYVAGQIIGLEPLLLPIIAAAAAICLWRRDWRVLAVVAILGAVLAFQVYAFLTGRTYGWLRFYISAVPLATMLVGLSVADMRGPRIQLSAGTGWLKRATRVVWESRWPRVIVGGVLVGFLASAYWPAYQTMADTRLGRGETAEHIHALVGRTGPGAYEPYSAEQAQGAREIALTLNAMDLEEGSVLVDSATAFPIIMQVADPRILVITSDRDFEGALADPLAYGVEYLLLPPDFQGHDALNRAYPDLYRSGTPFTEFVRTFDAPGRSPDWKLYRVIDNT